MLDSPLIKSTCFLCNFIGNYRLRIEGTKTRQIGSQITYFRDWIREAAKKSFFSGQSTKGGGIRGCPLRKKESIFHKTYIMHFFVQKNLVIQNFDCTSRPEKHGRFVLVPCVRYCSEAYIQWTQVLTWVPETHGHV